jgi:putative FmdB family regulatory protein
MTLLPIPVWREENRPEQSSLWLRLVKPTRRSLNHSHCTPPEELATSCHRGVPLLDEVADLCGLANMPTYSYRCDKCRKTFERTESISEHEKRKPQCPICGSKKVAALPARVYVVTSKKS